jgi:hypothetical protein
MYASEKMLGIAVLDPGNNPILIAPQSFTLSPAYPYRKDKLEFYLILQRFFGFQLSVRDALCD